MNNLETDFKVVNGEDAKSFSALFAKLVDRSPCITCLLNDLNLSDGCLARMNEKGEIRRRDARKILRAYKESNQELEFIKGFFNATTSDKTE